MYRICYLNSINSSFYWEPVWELMRPIANLSKNPCLWMYRTKMRVKERLMLKSKRLMIKVGHHRKQKKVKENKKKKKRKWKCVSFFLVPLLYAYITMTTYNPSLLSLFLLFTNPYEQNKNLWSLPLFLSFSPALQEQLGVPFWEWMC